MLLFAFIFLLSLSLPLLREYVGAKRPRRRVTPLRALDTVAGRY